MSEVTCCHLKVYFDGKAFCVEHEWPSGEGVVNDTPLRFTEAYEASEYVRAYLTQQRARASEPTPDYYEIQYKCPQCGNEWEETYDCPCDSDCPKCGTRNITALSYEGKIG